MYYQKVLATGASKNSRSALVRTVTADPHATRSKHSHMYEHKLLSYTAAYGKWPRNRLVAVVNNYRWGSASPKPSVRRRAARGEKAWHGKLLS